MNNKDLRKTAEVLLLIGAILDTIGHVLLTLLTFFIWTPFAVVLIPLLWVARGQALKGSKGWNIYGIIHGALTGWVTLVGHILLLISNNTNGDTPINNTQETL